MNEALAGDKLDCWGKQAEEDEANACHPQLLVLGIPVVFWLVQVAPLVDGVWEKDKCPEQAYQPCQSYVELGPAQVWHNFICFHSLKIIIYYI